MGIQPLLIYLENRLFGHAGTGGEDERQMNEAFRTGSKPARHYCVTLKFIFPGVIHPGRSAQGRYARFFLGLWPHSSGPSPALSFGPPVIALRLGSRFVIRHGA